MSFCPYFKNGYFGSCTASASNHIPTIAEMEDYCFGESERCPFFADATAKGVALDTEYAPIIELKPDRLVG